MSHLKPEEKIQPQNQSQVTNITITGQPTDSVPPVIEPENVRVNASSELALLVAFAMVMAVFAKVIK
ncbi:MAG: hypothetical protein QNJ42_08325 [Crocosphaera sp.]|nr:hypothetical protein [Crocosphaera sp.]